MLFVYALLEWKILQLAKLSISGAGINNVPSYPTMGLTSATGSTTLGQQSVQLSTISFPSSSNTFSLDDFLNPLTSGFKKYEVVESKEDLLTLSVARKRLDGDCKLYSTLIDDALAKNVIEEDRTKAAQIREYYQQRLVWWELKGITLTPFRESLKEFIYTDGLKFKENIIPLAWRLADFYEYDIDFDQFYSNYNQTLSTHDESTKVLTLVKTFDVKKKTDKSREFWFKDIHNNLVCIFVSSSNPLIDLLNYVAKEPIKVTANYIKMNRDGREFFKAEKLKFSSNSS